MCMLTLIIINNVYDDWNTLQFIMKVTILLAWMIHMKPLKMRVNISILLKHTEIGVLHLCLKPTFRTSYFIGSHFTEIFGSGSLSDQFLRLCSPWGSGSGYTISAWISTANSSNSCFLKWDALTCTKDPLSSEKTIAAMRYFGCWTSSDTYLAFLDRDLPWNSIWYISWYVK